MSFTTSSPRTRKSSHCSTLSNTDRTIATLATHQSLFATAPPPRQTNTPRTTRRQSLAKSTAASLAKMVPSLSKKVIDRGEQGSITDNTPQRQRTQSFSVSSLPRQLVRRSSLKVHDTTTSNKHGSVLNSTVPTQHRPSRDLSTTRLFSKQTKTETLDLKNGMDSGSDGDEPHKKKHQHRRSSLAPTNTNLSSSTHRRSSLVESTSEHHYHPSWLDSAGFMRPSKCAACHPPSPKRTTVITPPIGVAVPSFAAPPRRRSRGSLVFEKNDLGPSTKKQETTLVPADSGFASVEPREDESSPPKDSGSLMSEETIEAATTRFTSPAASSATSVSSISATTTSDFEQWTIQLRLALGRWFTDLNHGQLDHYDKDRSIMTITGMVMNMAPWLTTSTHAYRLRLGLKDRQQTFLSSTTWMDDHAVDQCQFKTDSSACDCSFDWMNRRHHCRSCGNIFCKEHSSNRLALFTAEKPNQIRWSRVCDACAFRLVGSHL